MNENSRKLALLVGTAAAIVATAPAFAQTTPGDQSGTPTTAGTGQSAATPTNAPAMPAAPPAAAPRHADSGGGAGDIIVTARRVEERLEDVPISITVFNQQQISNRNVVNAADLATYTPSLSTDTRFGSNNSTFAIRGFVQDIGTPPSVGVYFADVVSPRAASNNLPFGNGAGPGSFFDLQNVQVLKGPQGTLFGRNTTGGAVLLVPQKPTSKTEGYVEGSYGNFNMKRIQAVFNSTIGDNARFRIGVDHQDRDGYLKNISGVGASRYGDVHYTAVRASLVVDLTPDLENYTVASYLRSDSNGYGTKLIDARPGFGGASALLLEPLAAAQLAREKAAGAGFYDIESDFVNPTTTIDQWQVINTTTWKASDTLTIKNIASYAQLIADLASPVFGTAFDAHDAFGGLLAPAGSRLQFAASYPIKGGHSAAQNTITEEFQVQGSALNDKLTYQTGAYYELSQPLGPSGSISPILAYCQDIYTNNCNPPLAALGAGGSSVTESTTRYADVGLYAQGTYSFTDWLKLTGGFRYTWDSTQVHAESINYAFGNGGTNLTTTCSLDSGTPPNCAFKIPTQHSKAPTWLIDVDVKPTDDLLIYGKWARGYRSGGVTAQGPIPFRTYNPEKVDTYEGGVKYSFHGNVRGYLNFAGFYNNFSNQQVQIAVVRPPLSFFTATENLGKSRIWGLEAEGSITPVRGVTFDASYAYLNTKVKQVNATPNLAALGYTGYDVSPSLAPGDPLFLSPKHKVSVTGTYTLPLDESIGRVSVGATFTYTARMLATGASPTLNPNDPYNYLQATKLLNLNASWANVAGLPIDLSAFASNVTNKKYYAAISGTLNTVGFEVATPAEPRMFGGRIKYHF